MWYNAQSRQLQNNPPWVGWISDSVKAEQYSDWAEVANDFVMPRTPEEIALELQQGFTRVVQAHLDDTATLKGYDGILSATSYAGYTNQFQAEGIAYGVWRSAVWAKCYEIMAEVQAGKRSVPSESELIAELPTIVL